MRSPQTVAGVDFDVGNWQLFAWIRILDNYTAPDYHWLSSLHTDAIPGARHQDGQKQPNCGSKLSSTIHRFSKASYKRLRFLISRCTRCKRLF